MCYLNDRPPCGRAARCAPSHRVHPHGGCVPFSVLPSHRAPRLCIPPHIELSDTGCVPHCCVHPYSAHGIISVIFTLLFTTTSCVILSCATLPSPISLRASSSLVILVSIFSSRTDFPCAKFSQVTSLCTSPYVLQRGTLPPPVLPV